MEGSWGSRQGEREGCLFSVGVLCLLGLSVKWERRYLLKVPPGWAVVRFYSIQALTTARRMLSPSISKALVYLEALKGSPRPSQAEQVQNESESSPPPHQPCSPGRGDLLYSATHSRSVGIPTLPPLAAHPLARKAILLQTPKASALSLPPYLWPGLPTATL